jgi:hypothetical protein
MTSSSNVASKRLAIVGKLLPGSRERAQEIIAAGPPYEVGEAGLLRHHIFLSDDTVVFVFEGPDVEGLVSRIVDDPTSSGSFSVWGPLLAGTPALAHEEFFWEAG